MFAQRRRQGEKEDPSPGAIRKKTPILWMEDIGKGESEKNSEKILNRKGSSRECSGAFEEAFAKPSARRAGALLLKKKRGPAQFDGDHGLDAERVTRCV